MAEKTFGSKGNTYGADEFDGMEELEIDREALPAKAKRRIRSPAHRMAGALGKLFN